MKQNPAERPASSERIIRDIKRKTRKQYSAQEKICIVLDGLRGEDSIAELCRREGIAQSLYYKWSKEFMEAGKKRLAGDIVRQANTGEVTELRREARALKEVVAEQTLELRLLKKSMLGDGTSSNEIPCCREAGGHSTGGTITPAGQADIGHVGHSVIPPKNKRTQK